MTNGDDAKLVLVSASAGFGKTTLLAEWLDRIPDDRAATAWLSLDEHDNEPVSFWTYVVAAGEVEPLTKSRADMIAPKRGKDGPPPGFPPFGMR